MRPRRGIEKAIARTDEPMAKLAQQFVGCDRLFILGYGLGHAVALEGALKCKEVTGLPCEGMFSSEFKHGPLAMVEEETRCSSPRRRAGPRCSPTTSPR